MFPSIMTRPDMGLCRGELALRQTQIIIIDSTRRHVQHSLVQKRKGSKKLCQRVRWTSAMLYAKAQDSSRAPERSPCFA